MPCFVYIIKNKASGHYIGITKLFPEERVKRHNQGEVHSTRSNRPWQLIYSERFQNYKQARVREKQIKSWHGSNAFKKLLTPTGRSSNGRTSPSGGDYLGSNPSLPVGVRSKFGGVK